MKFKAILVQFIIMFLLVLVVGSLVTFLWNLIFHGVGQFEWETSFRMAIIFGIVFTWIMVQERKKKDK